MDIFTVYLVLLFHFTSLIAYTGGQCVLPIQGQWTMSRTNDNMNFASDVITDWNFPSAPAYIANFECVGNEASRYVMRGDALIPTERHVFVCLDFIDVGQNRAVFVQATQTGPGIIPTYGTALTDADANTGVLIDNICNLPQPYPSHRYHVFVRTGTSPSVPCPSVLQGLFQLSTPCTATADVCTDTSLVQMTFTGTACPTIPFEYGASPARCLYDVSDGTNTYVTLQSDEAYVCVVLSESESTVLMSQNPRECQESQTPTSGGTLFSLQKASCPTTTAPPVTTTTQGGGLTTATINIIIAIVVIAVIAIIIIIILIIICIKRRKRKERARKRAERREQRRAERRRRRFEREERRRQGLPVSDTESDYSTDSGYIRQSSSTSNEVDGIISGETEKKKKKKKRKKRNRAKKVRKIYDEDGNLVREEEIPIDPDDSEDDTVYVNKDGKRIRKRKVKKIRTYLRERTLSNGKTVKELVESEYSETCSEYSVTSSDEEDDPVSKEMRRAMRRRKKERDDMMDRIAEQQKDDLETRPEDLADGEELRPEETSSDIDRPGVSSESPDKRQVKPTDRGFRLVGPAEGPVITRPKYEERVSKEMKKGEKKSGFLKRLFMRKHKKAPPDETTDEDEEERDKYMNQYREKKRIEGKLEDEGFWEEDKAKRTAKEVFDIDRLEAILQGSIAADNIGVPPIATGSIIDKEPEDSSANETDSRYKDGTDSGGESGKVKSVKESTVKFKEGDSNEKESNDRTADEKTKKQVTARVSKLLTDRLFPTESKKQGHVIFVKEAKQGQLTDTKSHKPGSLPPLKNTAVQRSHPGHKGPNIIDAEKAAIYRDGLAKDQRFIDTLEAEDSEHFHFEEENGDENAGDGAGLTPLHRPYLKRSQYGTHSAFRGQIPEAWGTGVSNSISKGDRDKRKVPYTVSAPKFHSYLDFLRNWGPGDKPGNLTDRDASYNRGEGKSRRLLMDDARLKRLLEELYKDKKYMDAIIAAEECKNDEKVKGLAVHGRDYLLDMALYWEKKGPLPPRPSVTALGFKLERSKSMFKGGEHDSKPPPLQRNKTVC